MELTKIWNPSVKRRIVIEKELCSIDLSLILIHMESYFNVLPKDIVSKSRKRIYSVPRQVAYYVLRELGHKWIHIAEQFNRDHSTVMYGYDNVKDLKALIVKGHGGKSDIAMINKVDEVLNQVWLDNYKSKAA